ncbi:hypothetical protein E1218_19695 [Kribbella turkmenica]|uniref:Uncharacterized protein n=1 Tax=Kribbella turkmenica TaxID=2530375 RepID=A0A4R4WWT0_9ACTN|nr:hypothetical protein [Kribbella turkmenica]TDD22180.1 hypothetical protein E1218_19695 [Kribbella turkmenica]
MSIWERIKRWRLSHELNERDAPADTSTAMTRTAGGDPHGGTPATTGTGESDEFVGRVAGDEPEVGQSGAEARSEAKTEEGESHGGP